MSDANRLSAWAPHALALLRIVTALLFIEHGTQKYFLFPASQMFPEPVSVFSLMGLAGALEIIGGLLILVGLFTRAAAFVLSGEMAFAYFMAHLPLGFFPANNFGDGPILFCFVYLYLVFAGPGAWSVDGARAQAA
jgi:putative oxidoreductase